MSAPLSILSSRTFVPLLATSTLALSSACTTGQIGGEIEHNDGGHHTTGDEFAGGCEAVETTEIEVDESTTVGISAQDVIDAISGTHETSLSWGESINASGVTLTPDAGQTELTIEVIPRPDTAVLVDLELEESDSDDDFAEPAIDRGGPACADEIRVTADVKVTSANGALDDTFEVVFRARNADVISGVVGVELGELSGDFALSTEGNREPVQTELSLSFAFGTVSGEISGILQQESSNAVSASPIVYARFPVDGCDYGILLDAESAWGVEITSAVESYTTFDFSWDDGAILELTVEPTVGKLCLETNGYEPGGTVVGAVSAVVVTDDGRVDAEWPLEVRGQIMGDGLESLTVTHVEEEPLGYSAVEFPMRTGINGVESDAEALGFEFDYWIEPDGSGASGTLTVFELVIPDCAHPDYEPPVMTEPGGGQSSPGCEGVDYVELETGTFVSTPPGD